MRLHIGKAFKSLKLTDYLEEEEEGVKSLYTAVPTPLIMTICTKHRLRTWLQNIETWRPKAVCSLWRSTSSAWMLLYSVADLGGGASRLCPHWATDWRRHSLCFWYVKTVLYHRQCISSNTWNVVLRIFKMIATSGFLTALERTKFVFGPRTPLGERTALPQTL